MTAPCRSSWWGRREAPLALRAPPPATLSRVFSRFQSGASRTLLRAPLALPLGRRVSLPFVDGVGQLVIAITVILPKFAFLVKVLQCCILARKQRFTRPRLTRSLQLIFRCQILRQYIPSQPVAPAAFLRAQNLSTAAPGRWHAATAPGPASSSESVPARRLP